MTKTNKNTQANKTMGNDDAKSIALSLAPQLKELQTSTEILLGLGLKFTEDGLRKFNHLLVELDNSISKGDFNSAIKMVVVALGLDFICDLMEAHGFATGPIRMIASAFGLGAGVLVASKLYFVVSAVVEATPEQTKEAISKCEHKFDLSALTGLI